MIANQEISQMAEDATMQTSDSNQQGLSIGNQVPSINLDMDLLETQPNHDPRPETQGQWQADIDYYTRENERIQAEIDALYADKDGHHEQEIKNLYNELARNNENIYNIKNNGKYDNRTDEQKREDEWLNKQNAREDNSYQRTVQDMIKAGLNPMFLSGTNGAGGVGTLGSSRSEDEEEKRKKRRSELKDREMKQKEYELAVMKASMGLLGQIIGKIR